MIHRGTVVLLACLLAAVLAGVAVGAQGDDGARCDRFAADSVARAASDTGTGDRVVVIGDSWSAGLGLNDSTDSWPSRLPGRVHVAGFSGSGFSRAASSCGAEHAFAARASEAVRGGADLVVVVGGLNDYDQPDAEIRAGFDRLVRALDGRRVVVVGPAPAPSRADRVPSVDALLADLAASYDVAYVSAADWSLSYLDDRLHLTAAGHRAFGDRVAAELAALDRVAR